MVKSHVESTIPAVEEQGDEIPIRVLHVDDEAGFTKTTKQILEMQGPFEVESAPSVEEAFEKMKKKPFDAVVCDYVMPGKDGLEFLKELRDSGNNIPFVMFTGKGREEVAIEALNLGADRYINKIGRPKTVYGELAHGVMEAVETKRALEVEQLHKVLVENLQDAIVFTDLSGKGVFINRAAEKLTGYTKEEMLGKSPREIILPKYWPLCDELNIKTLTGQPVSYVEMEVRTKNGQTIPVETGGQIITKNGEITGLLIIVRDIRERKKAEDALRESEGKNRSLVELAPDSIVTADLRGVITSFNKAGERMSGFSKDEVIGKHFSELGVLHERDLPKYQELFDSALRGEITKPFEGTLYRKDGTSRTVEFRWGLLGHKGKTNGVQAFIRDITERKKAEKALREKEQKLKNVIEASPDAIIRVDRTGKITLVNRKGFELTGFSEKDIIGKNFMDIEALTQESKEKALESFMKRLEGVDTPPYEIEIVAKSGEIIPVEISSASIHEEDKIIGVQTILRDLRERKRTEEKLRESEERFRNLFESIQDPVGVYTGKEGHLIEYNEAFKKTAGYTDEELKDKTFLDFVHSEDHALVLERYRTKYAEEKLPLIYEVRGVNKEGEIIPLEISVSTYKVKGKVVGIVVVHRDITERKKTEEEIKAKGRFLESLIEQSPLPTFVTDPEGICVMVNKAFLKAYNVPKKEMVLGMNALTEPANVRQGVVKYIREALSGKIVETPEIEFISPYENKRTFTKSRLFPIFDTSNKLTNIVVIHEDITERKAMEKELRNSEERYRALLEETPIGISNIDFKGNLTYVNREFERITGFSREESLGKSWLNLASKHGAMSRENLRLAARLIMRRFMGKPDTSMKFQLERRDGSLRWVESNANLIKKHGVPVGLQAVSRDVTEIIASEKSLKEAMKELEVLNEKLRVIGELTRHDIRNKLQAAHNSLFLTKQKLRHDPEALQHMDVIESSCDHVEKILEFARTYERLGAEKLVCLDVEKSLKEAVSQFPDLHSVRVVNECRGLTVLADSMLRQLFHNLIDNSLKYGEKISQIRLFYEKAGKDKLKLIYEDNGVGIHKAEKEKIFNEGYGKGTGYGLYLIRKMCEVYGWTIQETGKHGKGAQFTITIPKTNGSGKIAYQLN